MYFPLSYGQKKVQTYKEPPMFIFSFEIQYIFHSFHLNVQIFRSFKKHENRYYNVDKSIYSKKTTNTKKNRILFIEYK